MDPTPPQQLQQAPVPPVKRFKWFIIPAILFGVLAIFLILNAVSSTISLFGPSATPTPIKPTPATQQPFTVTSTIPPNGSKNVFAGELLIVINTDKPIISPSSLKLDFTPKLKYYTEFQNSFPTNKVLARVLGGLSKNTTYRVEIKNSSDILVYAWSFTTSDVTGESQSNLRVALDKQIDKDYYPLTPYLPYSTDKYLLGYAAHKELKITLKQPNLDQTAILSEVKAWVKSKGIDPESHTYVFVQQ